MFLLGTKSISWGKKYNKKPRKEKYSSVPGNLKLTGIEKRKKIVRDRIPVTCEMI